MSAASPRVVSLGLALALALVAPATPSRPQPSQPASAQAGPASDAPPILEPFAAHYTADWKTINVGTSDIELTTDGSPGHYLYTWTVTARGIFRLVYSNDVIQKSWMSVVGNHVRPEKYRAEQGQSTVNIDFDWDGGHARGTNETKPVDLKLREGTQDVMSIQIEVMQDLRNGNLPKTFNILDKDEIKEFLYTQEGPTRIRTALGELDTVVVASQREGGNRILRMWFAPSLGYVPVQAERTRDGKLEFALRIKTLKQAGQDATPPAEPPPT
jgi:Protein of unknown function (DUF3108)